MSIIDKKDLMQWIQGIDDEKILDLKIKNEILSFENQITQKGLNDILLGNVSSHEEVKKRFEAKFARK